MKSAPWIIRILLALYIINSHGTEFNPPPMSDIIVNPPLVTSIDQNVKPFFLVCVRDWKLRDILSLLLFQPIKCKIVLESLNN